MPKTGARRHLLVYRRPSWERSGRLLLVALAEDRPEGHPDNVSAAAAALGVTEPALRSFRRSCLDDGLLISAGGWLRPGPELEAWRQRARADFEARGLRWGADPLPRRFLAGRRRPAVVHAAAVCYHDAVGWERDRRYVRGDDERAAMANVSRPTIRSARRELERAGLTTTEQVQRGRAGLRRCALTEDRKATHGAPMAQRRAQELAARADRHRRAAMSSFPTRNEAPATPNCVSSATPNCVSTHHQEPTVPVTTRAEIGPDLRGLIAARRPDGSQADSQKTRQECEAFFGDRRRIEHTLLLAKRRPEHALREILAVAGCWDGSNKRRTEWPKALLRRWHGDAPALLLAVVADVVAGTGRSYAKNIGAVVATRLPKLLAGRPDDALSDTHKGAAIADILAAAAGVRSIARTA